MNANIEKRKRYHSLRVTRSALLACTIGLFVSIQTASADPVPCLNDETAAGSDDRFNNPTCTANDVRISKIEVLAPINECTAGNDITFAAGDLQVEYSGGSKERYDVGAFLDLDGGSARTATGPRGCFRDFLNPITSIPGDEDLVSGSGPFPNLESDEDPGDLCGDIRQGETVLKDLGEITIKCQDTDGDTFVDVGTCLSWDNKASAGTNQKPSCEVVEDAVPGTPSKCRCEPIQVGEITVIEPGTIIIVKEGFFNASFTDTIMSPNGFSLIPSESKMFTEVEPGTYTVTETVGSISLTNIDCVEDKTVNSTGNLETNSATIVLEEGETVTCTFTNNGA